MTSRIVGRCELGLMLLASLAAVNPAAAQTSLGWGQHVSRYGSGYVGNTPNTIPMTSYYRSPAITAYGQANTAYYYPGAVAPAAYSPGVSYRVGTPNAAAYSSAYSPIVTPTTPYAANWQYPPQTVMPTVANYAPAPPVYTTNYAQVPVTYYRPVTVMSPLGVPQTVLQPCTGAECQAQRKHQGFFGWLFHRNPPTTANYGCAGGYCGQPAPTGTPYYTPGPASAVTPLGSGVPANVAPSLGGPPPVGSSPAFGSGTTNIVPNTGSGINVSPPSDFSSGGHRADYPPADAYCPPTRSGSSSFMPNVSPPRAGELMPFSPSGGIPGDEPADDSPTLNRPANAPIGSGVFDSSATPRATLRKDDSVTPIPDPEYTNGTRAKVNKAPQLLSPTRDRTAKVTQPEARLATYEQTAPAARPAPAASKVLGDDIWRAKK